MRQSGSSSSGAGYSGSGSFAAGSRSENNRGYRIETSTHNSNVRYNRVENSRSSSSNRNLESGNSFDRNLDSGNSDSGWKHNSFDGGRGRESSRNSSSSYYGPDGTRVSESRREYQSSHNSLTNSGNRVGSENNMRGFVSERDQYGESRNNQGRPASSYDSGWKSNTFDSGRGQESSRRSGGSFRTDDGVNVAHDRNEYTRSHSSSNTYNTGANDNRNGLTSDSHRTSTIHHSSTSNSDLPLPVSEYYDGDYYEDEEEGGIYSKAVVDEKNDNTNVMSRVSYGGNNQDSTSGNFHDPSRYPDNSERLRHGMIRMKRETVVKPEAYTDEKTGRTMQVVNLVSRY